MQGDKRENWAAEEEMTEKMKAIMKTQNEIGEPGLRE